MKHTDVTSSRRPRIDSNDNASLESERQRRRSVLDLNAAAGVGVVVRMQAKESSGLHDTFISN